MDAKAVSEHVAGFAARGFKGRDNLEGIYLGMTPEDVRAVCSAGKATELTEWRQATGLDGRRVPPSFGKSGSLTPPFVDRVSCRISGGDLTAYIAPPPTQPRVVEVTFVRQAHGSADRIGSYSEYVRGLQSKYGTPRGTVEETLPSDRAHYLKWLFPSGSAQVECVVSLPGQHGGKVFVPGIPAGGPCATHIIARVWASDGDVRDARISLVNPDRVAGAEDAHLHMLQQQGAKLEHRWTYEDYAANAKKAGLQTREMQAQHKLWEKLDAEAKKAERRWWESLSPYERCAYRCPSGGTRACSTRGSIGDEQSCYSRNADEDQEHRACLDQCRQSTH